MSNNTEINLITRLRADDRKALQHLFEDHYEMVCQSIYRFVPDTSTAEDLAQEVFLRFWEKRHKIEINSSIGAYIRRMAINEGLGYLRKNKRWEQEAFEPGHEPGVDDSAEDRFLHEEMQASVTAAINQLPPKCRTVFQLSRYEELTYREIAEQLDISIKTVENQMGKALKVLRVKLQHYLQVLLLILFVGTPFEGSAKEYSHFIQPEDVLKEKRKGSFQYSENEGFMPEGVSLNTLLIKAKQTSEAI